MVRRLEGAVERWTADPATFLLASEAGVQEVMNMKHEKAQKIADELDQVCRGVGVQYN